LTEEQAKRFVESRRAAGLVTWAAPASLDVPLGYLRGLGVAPSPASARPRGPLEELLAGYHDYLLSERGLCEHTVFDGYGPAAALFLAEFVGPEGRSLERLGAAEVTAFLARECPKRSVSGARDLAGALRSLLRYLHLAGLIQTPLVWAVPSLADLRDRALPRGLEPRTVRKLLASLIIVGWSAGATTRSCWCWYGWDCAPVRSPRWNSTTWIGAAGCCSSTARVPGRTSCRCRPMSARRSLPTCVVVRDPSAEHCSRG